MSILSNNKLNVNNKDINYTKSNKSKTIIEEKKNYQQNKASIIITYLYLFKYTYNKNINLLLVVNSYFGFDQNMPK